MGAHQIQALISGLLAAFLAWQLVLTLVKGEVTISLSGRGVKRADDAKGYWAWTLILGILLVVVALSGLKAALHR